MTKCLGCGATLQTKDLNAPGYTPKEGSKYCKRCFRLIHYDDLTVSMRKGIDPDQVVKQIAGMDALIVWVVDLYDFESSMITGLNRLFFGKDIIMVATKRDLLPDTLTPDKTARFVFTRLKEQGITIRSLVLTSNKDEEGTVEVKEAIDEYANGRPAVVMGKANAGKSTLLNRLLGSNDLTMSRYPGTTLDFNEIKINGQTYIDTPGIEISNSMLMEVEEKNLRTIIPERQLKPTVFQLKDDQSFALGGLARLDLAGCEKASAVFYMSDELAIHRSKVASADALWQKHFGEMLKPIPNIKKFRKYTTKKEEDKMDIVIDGLGWICVHGKMSIISVYVPEDVHVTFRKAML